MSNTQTLPESVEQRIQAAATIVDGYRTKDQIRDGLIELGVKTLDDLNEEWCSKGDLLHVVGLDDPNTPTPKIPAHKAVAALYGSQKAATSARTEQIKAAGIKITSDDASTDDLLKLYRPELTEDAVTRILKKRFDVRKVIVFVPGTNDVDIEATLGYIADLDQGLPELEFVRATNGELARPVAVGEKAEMVLDEDPLYPGQPLRRDRSAGVGLSNWAGIPEEVRQLCRIVVNRGDIDVDSRSDVNALLTLARKGFAEVAEVYPEAAVLFRERKARKELPSLKITLNGDGREADPFNVSKHRRY